MNVFALKLGPDVKYIIEYTIQKAKNDKVYDKWLVLGKE